MTTKHCKILKLSTIAEIVGMTEREEWKEVAFYLARRKGGLWVGKRTVLCYLPWSQCRNWVGNGTVSYDKVNKVNCQDTNIFLHNKNTNFNHGISTIEMHLLTFVVTYDLQFTVVMKIHSCNFRLAKKRNFVWAKLALAMMVANLTAVIFYQRVVDQERWVFHWRWEFHVQHQESWQGYWEWCRALRGSIFFNVGETWLHTAPITHDADTLVVGLDIHNINLSTSIHYSSPWPRSYI